MTYVYDINKSYTYNFNNGPFFDHEIINNNNLKKVKLWDYELNNPIGIGAGILLNSKWVKLFSKLDYSVLTYKTVRPYKQAPLPMPNCSFVNESDGDLYLSQIPTNKNITITNHFGIPSQDPNFWIEDVNKSVELLKPNQILILSIYGKTSLELLKCANYASETQAHVIEINLSCPNVDNELYLDRQIILKIRKIIKVPLILKLGFPNNEYIEYIKPLLKYVDGISVINALPIKNMSLCGSMLYNYLMKSLESYTKLSNLPILAMGGINSAERVTEVLKFAKVASIVTHAIFDPLFITKL